MSVAADTGLTLRPSRIARLFRLVFDMIVGAAMCLTPVTAILALGWLRRRMASVIHAGDAHPQRVGWIMGDPNSGFLSRLLGGLVQNIRAGLGAGISLALVVLPFGGLWALAWWAGWTNSFTKGYEQALAGPGVFLGGVALFLVVWAHLPMALAHQAAKGRMLAFFDIKGVRYAVRRAGWSYLWLMLTTLFFTLPLFAARGLVAFAPNIIPGFENMGPDKIASVAGAASMFTALYVFVSLWILRSWAARIYLRATSGERRTFAPFRGARMLTILAAGLAFAFLIVVGQFLNHSYWVWLNHPFLMLPWWG